MMAETEGAKIRKQDNWDCDVLETKAGDLVIDCHATVLWQIR